MTRLSGWYVRSIDLAIKPSSPARFNNGKLKTLTTTAYKSDGTSEVTEKHDVGYLECSRYENGHWTTDSFILKRGDGQTTCTGPTPCEADYDYDAREKLVKHQNRAGSVATYTLDEPSKLIGDTSVRAGNVTTEVADGSTTSRRYEGNQLKEMATGASTASYVYDNYGNVDCVTLGAGGTSCPNGGTSLVADYAYDNLNRMVSQKTYGTPGTATDTADYTYDALDRINKEVETHEGTTDDRTTDFTHQGLSNLVTEEKQSGGSNAKTKTFSYDAYGHRIAMTDKNNATGVTETFTYATDVHGSVSQLISEAGTVKASYGYTAYGSRDNSLTTGDLNDKAPLNPYRYTGKRLDSGSATTAKPASSVDMGARRFGVDTGRFLQQDMFANALGDLALNLDPLTQNTYALAGGNPVSFVEVDGHMLMANGGGGSSPSPNPTSGSSDPIREIGKNIGDDLREKWALHGMDAINGAVVGGLTEWQVEIMKKEAAAQRVHKAQLEGHYQKTAGGTPQSRYLINEIDRTQFKADAYELKARNVAGRVGSKIPVVGVGITAVNIGYDITQGKGVTKSIASGVGGALAAAAAGAKIGAFAGTFLGGPLGTVVGAAAGAVVGVAVSYGIEWAFDNQDKIEGAISDAEDKIADVGSAVGEGAKDAWNSLFG